MNSEEVWINDRKGELRYFNEIIIEGNKHCRIVFEISVPGIKNVRYKSVLSFWKKSFIIYLNFSFERITERGRII